MKQAFSQINSFQSNITDYKYCPCCGKELISDTNNSCPSCKFIQYKNPLPGVSVLIENSNNEILVGRRRGDHDLWCMPCGFIETNENFLQAGHREVFEETGLKIEIKSIINVTTNIIRADLETLVVVLYASVVSGNMEAGDDITKLVWVNSQKIPRLAFNSDKYIIGEYFKGKLEFLSVDEAFRRQIQ